MAITGTKSFTSGEILTAANTNQYLMRGVKVFADAATRTAAYGGVSQPTLEEGEASYLLDTNLLYVYDGAAWQVVGPDYMGTSLPSSPTDGMEYVLVDSLSAPTYRWRFRYNASSASSYKWEFIGGTAAYALVDTQQTTTSATFTALATAGPSFTVPRAGDYMIEIGFQGGNGNANCNAIMSYDIGASAAADADACFATYQASTTSFPSVARKNVKTGLAASTALVSKYRVGGGAGTAYFQYRWLFVQPLRVS